MSFVAFMSRDLYNSRDQDFSSARKDARRFGSYNQLELQFLRKLRVNFLEIGIKSANRIPASPHIKLNHSLLKMPTI